MDADDGVSDMRPFAPLLVVTALALAGSGVVAAGEPSIVMLGTLGGDESVPAAVNDRGQVVGTAQTDTGAFNAFLWQDGTMIDLAPGFAWSAAFDVNDHGQVVLQRATSEGGPVESVLWSRGTSISLGAVNARFVDEHGRVAGTVLNLDDPANPNTSPFIWDRGTRTDLGPIPGWAGPDSRVVDFDDRGTVLGMGLGPESFELGFVWAGSPVVPVGDPRAFGGDGVVDLNAHGQVLGADFVDGVFVWDAGELDHLGSPPGRGPFEPVALNDGGEVAGTSASADVGPERAFLWQRGRFTEVGSADGAVSRAVDLNDRGQLVGDFVRVEDGASTPSVFLWQDGEFTDLGAGQGAAMSATAISEHGHVIGTSTNEAGLRQAFLVAVR